ncbi:MAG: hypothetical protein MUO70_07190 [Euryarchaeota archaeon]|nr:hypothetical protein [Euryarchaeota archaeon]
MREWMGPLMPGQLWDKGVGEAPGVPYIAGRYFFAVIIAIHIPGGLQLLDMVKADRAFALLSGSV